MKSLHLRPLAVAAAALCLGSAQADDGLSDMFKLSGFGTFGFVHNSTDQAQYKTGAEPSGSAADTRWDIDSLIAGQLDATFSKQFSSTVQVLAERKADNSSRPAFEWAFLKYAPIGNLKLRAGRLALPLFMVSDSRLVGYANPEVRPPYDTYFQVSFTHVDGIDAVYSMDAGAGTLTFQPYFGKTSAQFAVLGSPTLVTLDWKRIRGLAVSYDLDNLSMRAGAARGNVVASNDPLAPLWNALRNPAIDAAVPSAVGLANYYQLSGSGRPAGFYDVGASYDASPFNIQGEYSWRKGNSIISNTKGWYLTGTYKIGQFTPYLTYSRLTTTSATSDSTISSSPTYQQLAAGYAAGVLNPAQLAAFQGLAGLQGAFNATLLSLSSSQHTVTVGSRWDFYKNVDLKLQCDFIQATPGQTNAWVAAKPTWNGKAHVISGVLDFVF